MYKSLSIAAKSLAFLLATTAVASPIEQLYKEVLDKRDPPRALAEHATEDELKYQPAMDFDTDGCYNVPAIDADGNVSPGLKAWMQYDFAKDCRDESDLDNNNVYVRTRCNNGWCAYLYAYYFEKDVGSPGVVGPGGGHTHDWEHIVVFVNDEGPQVVAVSQHSDYETKAASDVRWHEETHPKVVYHKQGGSTHCFRFANSGDDKIENHKGTWFFGALIDYYTGFPNEQVRETFLTHDFESATLAFTNPHFKSNLNKARDPSDGSQDMVPGFDSGKDE